MTRKYQFLVTVKTVVLEWIKKMWYIYIAEYYSVIKKNEEFHGGPVVRNPHFHCRRAQVCSLVRQLKILHDAARKNNIIPLCFRHLTDFVQGQGLLFILAWALSPMHKGQNLQTWLTVLFWGNLLNFSIPLHLLVNRVAAVRHYSVVQRINWDYACEGDWHNSWT